MKQLDELIYDAICADDDLMDAIGGRVESTCFEVSPEEQDNTPVPYLIVTDDGFQNNLGTKKTSLVLGKRKIKNRSILYIRLLQT